MGVARVRAEDRRLGVRGIRSARSADALAMATPLPPLTETAAVADALPPAPGYSDGMMPPFGPTPRPPLPPPFAYAVAVTEVVAEEVTFRSALAFPPLPTVPLSVEPPAPPFAPAVASMDDAAPSFTTSVEDADAPLPAAPDVAPTGPPTGWLKIPAAPAAVGDLDELQIAGVVPWTALLRLELGADAAIGARSPAPPAPPAESASVVRLADPATAALDELPDAVASLVPPAPAVPETKAVPPVPPVACEVTKPI